MNWQEKEKKYPKGLEKLFKDKNLRLSWGRLRVLDTDEIFNIRDLYDFFDANGIRGFIIPSESLNNFDYVIHIKEIHPVDASDIWPLMEWVTGIKVRTEAEAELFTECFGILEEQIGENSV